MKTILLLLATLLAAMPLAAQTSRDVQGSIIQDGGAASASLVLFTNGNGRILPYRSGQMLETGRSYCLAAIPARGFAFSGWEQVVIFTFTEWTRGPSGTTIERTSTDVIPYEYRVGGPLLKFVMEPEEVIFYYPNVRIITRSHGWQANFEPAGNPGRHIFSR